jgi:hypothetical protein
MTRRTVAHHGLADRRGGPKREEPIRLLYQG